MDEVQHAPASGYAFGLSRASSSNELPRACVEIAGRDDLHHRVEMPRRMPRARRDAAPLEPEALAAARTGGDLDDGASLEGRHVEIAAQRGLDDTHRHFADEIAPLAPEQWVGLDADVDVGVSGRAASDPVVPLPGMRIRSASSMPAGMRVLTFSVKLTRPLPRVTARVIATSTVVPWIASPKGRVISN